MTSIRPDGRVEFRFFRPNAADVKVLGTFAEWEGEPLALQDEGDGWWTAAAMILPGEYRFRYWADGHWYTDFASHGVEMDKHGWNSVLVVPDVSPSMAIPRNSSPAMTMKYRFEDEITLKSAA